MIYLPQHLPVAGQLCREFGHIYVTTYTRPWRKFFRMQTREVCVGCDPKTRYEALQSLTDYIRES